MTDPSSECSTDTEAIAVDETYYAAFENATNSCPEAETQEGNTITVDYSVCDPDFTNSLTEACNAVNGKLEIQRTITILFYFSFFFTTHHCYFISQAPLYQVMVISGWIALSWAYRSL